MEQELLFQVASACQGLAGCIVLSGYVPQIVRLMNSRNTSGLSPSSWLLWCLANTLSLFYAVVTFFQNGQGLMLVLTIALNLSCILMILAMILMLEKQRRCAEGLAPESVAELLEEASTQSLAT